MSRKQGELFARMSLDYADHPKIAALSDGAFRAHVEMILWSRKYLTDGRIPKRFANRFGNPAGNPVGSSPLDELLANDDRSPSLIELEDGDYMLHDYADHQETRADVEARRLVNAENGRRGGRPPKRTGTDSVTDSVTDSGSNSGSDSGSEKKAETETETYNPPTPQRGRESIDGDFAAWWQHYPRKVGKGQAVKAYRAARRKTDHATLVAAIDAQADRLMAKGTEYCPHPATWLNGERWADETTPPPIDDAPDESWISKPAPDWMYDADLVEKLIEEASGG